MRTLGRINKQLSGKKTHIWETHGIHIGTGKDHVKHGIDQIDTLIKHAIKWKFPSLTFIIHTPRLTRYRYEAEKNTDIKFIRGDTAFFNYAGKMEKYKKKYEKKINIRYGIEMEWLGLRLGLQWNRAKIFQAHGVDFIIGAVHFSNEGIPYDESKKTTDKLIKLRGGLEYFWAAYIEEMIEMIDASWDMIHVIGHIDLPKIYAPFPEPLKDLENSSHFLARRMRILLEMISDYNFAIDLNLSGLQKGCGVFPDSNILKRAKKLGIPIAIGTDTHYIEELGKNYDRGIEIAKKAGYKFYVSFSKGIPEKRPFNNKELKYFKILNLGIEMLNRRFQGKHRLGIPKFSFGGSFKMLQKDFPDSVSMGEYNAVRVRKEERAITLSNHPRKHKKKEMKCLFLHHVDTPGTLSILFNTLASEEINVETAYLIPLDDGTATAYLTLTGSEKMIKEAIDFVMGTASDKFFKISYEKKLKFLPYRKAPVYLLDVDGVELPIPVSKHMILTIHDNSPGVLLILLSALASCEVNIKDLQLGKRGDKGFAVLGVEGDNDAIARILHQLGPKFHEASYLVLQGL